MRGREREKVREGERERAHACGGERESEKAAVVWWDLGCWVAPEKDKMWSESQVF